MVLSLRIALKRFPTTSAGECEYRSATSTDPYRTKTAPSSPPPFTPYCTGISFSRPGKPTINALVESFNGTIRPEFLAAYWFTSLTEANARSESMICAPGCTPRRKEICKGTEFLAGDDNSLGAKPVDLLLRYQTNFERALDRTQNELERLLRMRNGQLVRPTLNVNVST